MNSAFDVSYEASLYGTSDEDSSDNDNNKTKILPTLGDYKSQVIKGNYAAFVKSPQLQSETQLDPDTDVKTVKETELLPISGNEEGQSCVSFKKESGSKSASVKEKTVNNEKADNLLENNIEIETNNLRIPEKLSIQTKINKSLQRDEETYELEKFKNNAMIIFNHENFLVGDRRLGTALDVAALEDTFKQFRFTVTTRNDLTRQELFDELKQFSKMDFKHYGCICVAILTHGQDDGFLRAYDTRYRERDVFSCFDALANSDLVAKPIIFLIQACRGSTAAVLVPNSGGVQNVEFDVDTSENSCRPTESDMIIFHSSFFGRASVRVVAEGSWFIQTLCEQMKLHGSTDHLEKLFRRVRRIVALDKEYKGVKQMPVVTTTLLKKLYLKKIDDSYKQIDGSNSEKDVSHVTVKTKVTNIEAKRLTLVFKHALRFVIGRLLTLLIFRHDVGVSSCILILFLFLFELIRYKVYKAYIALFNEVRHFTIFLVLFNFFFRSFLYYFKGYDDVIFFVYLFGGWYFIGVTYIIFMFGSLSDLDSRLSGAHMRN